MNEVWIAIWPILQTAILAIGIWRIQVLLSRSDSKRKHLEQCREKYQVLMLRCSGAGIKLGKATARALRDGRANGEVTRALEYAERVEREQDDFMDEQATHKLM